MIKLTIINVHTVGRKEVDRRKFRHPYHIVNPSPLPFLLSFSVFGLLLSAVFYMHSNSYYSNIISLILLLSFSVITILFMSRWWLNVIYESFFGYHTIRVKKGLKLGFVLFIISEVMFFFGFFWAYFHSSLSPAIEIGSIWPPLGISTFDPMTFPLLNTLVLILSGVSITFTHYFMFRKKYEKETHEGFTATLVLALVFLYVQFDEFYCSPFSISDGIYGSCFYMITGLHGFHVIVGALFILVCFARYNKEYADIFWIRIPSILAWEDLSFFFTDKVFLGFEFASWYWHFVDVVWLYVYTFLYWWGSI